MRVRAAGPGDEADLEALLGEVYAAFGEEPPAREDVRALVTHAACGDSGLAFLVAETGTGDAGERFVAGTGRSAGEGGDVGGRLVGIVSVAPVPTTLAAGAFVYVDDLYVRPAFRGRGVGSELLAAARRWAIERGACEMRLAADASDEPLWRLYRAAGYQRQRMSWMVLDLGADWSRRRP